MNQSNLEPLSMIDGFSEQGAPSLKNVVYEKISKPNNQA